MSGQEEFNQLLAQLKKEKDQFYEEWKKTGSQDAKCQYKVRAKMIEKMEEDKVEKSEVKTAAQEGAQVMAPYKEFKDTITDSKSGIQTKQKKV